MIASDVTLRELIASGLADPVDPLDIQPASIDLRLAPVLRSLGPPAPWATVVSIDPRAPVLAGPEIVTTDDQPYPIQPGEVLLASTTARLNLPPHVAGMVWGKSSLGRIGLQVHAAGWVDPGFRGTLVLELFNLSRSPILLRPRMKIAQIAFTFLDLPAERPYGSPSLGSRYQDQVGPVRSLGVGE